MKHVLLLTGCVNPKGMTQTALTDIDTRRHQYEEAIQWYVSNTNLPIVFAENSGTPITTILPNNRIEMLSFEGNQNKERGKGYGEMEIIEYALKHSQLLTEDCIVTKVTGRLIVRNINTLVRLHRIFDNRKSVMCQIHSNLKFADSRIFTSSASFLRLLASQKERLNDSQGYFFEHLLADNLRGRFLPYFVHPAIQGVSGTTGDRYDEGDKTLKERWRFLRYQLYLLKKHKAWKQEQ